MKQRRGQRAGGGLGPAAWEPEGGQGGGEELEGAEGVCFPHLLRAEVACGGVATVADGGGRGWTRRRRYGLGEGTRGGRRGCRG